MVCLGTDHVPIIGVLREMMSQYLEREREGRDRNTYMHNIYTYIHICGMLCGRLQRKTVHTFVMCAHFVDVRTLHLMLHYG